MTFKNTIGGLVFCLFFITLIFGVGILTAHVIGFFIDRHAKKGAPIALCTRWCSEGFKCQTFYATEILAVVKIKEKCGLFILVERHRRQRWLRAKEELSSLRWKLCCGNTLFFDFTTTRKEELDRAIELAYPEDEYDAPDEHELETLEAERPPKGVRNEH